MSADPDRPWPYAHARRVEYGDLDANAHVNNVTFLRYFETARISYVRELHPGDDPFRSAGGGGLIFAECHIAYRSPAHYDEALETRVRPAEVWRSAFRIEFQTICVGDGRLLAEGWGTLVGYRYAEGRATQLADDLRERLLTEGGFASPPE